MSFGWLDVVDLVGISTARATEMMVKIGLLVMPSHATPIFNSLVTPQSLGRGRVHFAHREKFGGPATP